MLENQRKDQKMNLRSTSPVTEEEAKGLQFPKRKRNNKKQDRRADAESERDETNNQANIVQTLFQSPNELNPTQYSNSQSTNRFKKYVSKNEYHGQPDRYKTIHVVNDGTPKQGN